MKAIEILSKPLTANEIEWKVIASKGGTTTIAPYIDNRAVMNRLDAAFGPFGWQTALREVQGGGGWLAGIGVRDEDGKWVWKWDGSGPSEIEPVKGGISGAMKRAATQWGIGRELYNYPRVIIEGEHRYIPWKVLERLAGLPKAVAEGKPLPEVIRLTAEGEAARKGGVIPPPSQNFAQALYCELLG